MTFEQLLNKFRNPQREEKLRTWFMNGDFDKLLHHFTNNLLLAEELLKDVLIELEGKNPNNLYIFTDSITSKLMQSSYFSDQEKQLVYALMHYCITRRNVEVITEKAEKEQKTDTVNYS